MGYNYQPVGHSNAGLSFQPGFSGGLDTGASYDAPSYTAPAEFDKEFYSYSAPDGEFDDPNAAQKIAGAVKQGLRVVFIKGPENKGLEDAALALAKQAADQKTAIYVLNKQADIGDLANRLNAINRNSNNKPEVHFVKYRTPEDAANAQNAIQSQYDSLGGSSQSHNGGVAPVLNFASQASIPSRSVQTPDNAYLPSSVLRRRF